MDTVTLTIDGRQVTVEKGKTLLQAAIQHGHEVPYYCYHPGLGVDGSCRVCIVKIEKMGKLQTACSTACTDGMIVLAVYLTVIGLAGLVALAVPLQVTAVLALLAGVLILIGR